MVTRKSKCPQTGEEGFRMSVLTTFIVKKNTNLTKLKSGKDEPKPNCEF